MAADGVCSRTCWLFFSEALLSREGETNLVRRLKRLTCRTSVLSYREPSQVPHAQSALTKLRLHDAGAALDGHDGKPAVVLGLVTPQVFSAGASDVTLLMVLVT